MTKYLTCTAFAFLLTCISITAQRKVLSYPFEFEKSFLSSRDYEANILCDKTSDNLVLVLHDNKKAEYALLGRDFKTAGKISVPIEKSIFDFTNEKYLGGTLGTNNIYYLAYRVPVKKLIGSSTTYQVEVVDFNNKTISNRKMFDLEDDERSLVSFSDFGEFYFITTNNKTGNIQIYNLQPNGEIRKNKVEIPIPKEASRKRNELSEYLAGCKLIKDDDDVGLETATHSAKLFSYSDKLVFIVNDNDEPTRVITINKRNLSSTDQTIDHAASFTPEERGKSYVNSFLDGERLFSLVLNRRSIAIAVYNIRNNTLLKLHKIAEESDLLNMAEPPVNETRIGKRTKSSDMTSVKKLVSKFSKGTEGLSVSRTDVGQYVITVGTYDPIQMSSGSRSTFGPDYTSPIGNTGMYRYSYTPGVSGYLSTNANYYRSTYFKVLLDPASLEQARGKVPMSTGDQIKDFVDAAGKKPAVVKQFALGSQQYYGTYNSDLKAFEIENIPIRK